MDHMEMYPLVKEVVKDWVENGDVFTAYDVTTDLKGQHDVQHSIVRPAVHTLMLEHLESGDYAKVKETYPLGWAWKYQPTHIAAPMLVPVTTADGQPSQAVVALGYDHLAGDLLVEFRSGGIYRYKGVPATVFAEFLNAPSKGGFFHERSKDVYT